MEGIGTGNGLREALGELRGDVKALLRAMAALQADHHELQRAFTEVTSEFAQHIAVHIEQDKAAARQNAERQWRITSLIAISAIASAACTSIAVFIATRLLGG